MNDGIIAGGGTVRYFRNADDTARAVSIDSTGIHLSTYATDAGVTLGRFSRTYFFAGHHTDVKEAALAAADANVNIETLKLSEVVKDDDPQWTDSTPVAHIGRSQGMILRANRHQVGLAAGIRRDAMIALPKRGSSRLILKVSTTRPSELFMCYRRYPEGPR
jgi:hypothetical protein